MKKRFLLILTVVCVLLAAIPVSVFADTEIPFLSDAYQGTEARLKNLQGEDRAYSYSGPGKDYLSSGGYKPYKQQRITVYFRDNGWYLTDVVYQTAEERFVYFRKSDFQSVPDSVPEVDSLPSWDGMTLCSVMPAWGPGSRFNRVERYTVPGGTPIRVFFQENGFVYAEYQMAGSKTRMWLPADQVSLNGAAATVTAETQAPYVISQFGKPTTPKAPEAPGDGSWSAWSDIPIEAADGLEVETRAVYRRKNEIADWTPWIDGDGDSDDPFVETRMVEDENGYIKWQWREYGYHYHYGDWHEWSENPFANVVSSSDICESKIQYRCRKIK